LSLRNAIKYTAILALTGAAQVSLFAQVAPQILPSPAQVNLRQFAEPAVPADPLELVTGEAQPVQSVTQRAEIINLLIEARRHGNVRLSPYDLKTQFTAFGSSGSDGSWQLEDTSPGRGLYRWPAQGPSYSALNLYNNRVLYSNQPAASVPIRLAQVRAALFFVQPMLGPRAAIRTASANLNGVELTCVLVSHGAMRKNTAAGRSWEESEYCVDPKSLNLITYSPIPGLYVLYDYSKNLQFDEQVIANKFTITQAGHTIIEAQTESITDPPENPAAFQPAGLNEIGVGPIMTEPWRIRTLVPSAAAAGSNGFQIVVLHGMQNPDGRFTDLELIASTSASLNNAAIEYAAAWQDRMIDQDVETGATPQSHEVFLTLQYPASQ
jgi:hypothetical protein